MSTRAGKSAHDPESAGVATHDPESAGKSAHATALVVGETGLLILGASSAGKSALALALLGAATAQGIFARLIADDRVVLSVRGGRLIARPHPLIAGQIEARGAGILPIAHLGGAVIRAVIALEAQAPRLPDAAAGRTPVAGITLPRLALRPDADLSEKVHLVRQWLQTPPL